MTIAIEDAKIGLRARFTGKDKVFTNQLTNREGKLGTIVADADLNPTGSDFGTLDGGTCCWRVDGDTTRGWYVTALADLTVEP